MPSSQEVGSALAASWIHSILFTVEFFLAIRYFTRFNTFRRFNLLVAVLVINGTVTFIANCAFTWKMLITNRGTTVNKHSWPLPLMIICNNIAATLGQCFLVYRYYGLSRAMLMTAFVLLMIIAHAASGTTVAVSMIVHPEFGHRLVALASTVAFSVSAAIDIFIPMLLIWELRKIKTTHAYTQSLIRRAMVNALSSGCIVALAEIFLLILFWTRSPYELLGCPTLAPFYPITVLVNLFVGQRRVRVPASSFKTANLTTLDSSQFRRSVDFHHDHDLDKSENKESDGSTLSRTVTP